MGTVWLSSRWGALDAVKKRKWAWPAFFGLWGRKGFMATKAEKLIEVLEPLADENGLELVTVEIAGTKKNPILRV